MTDFKTSDRDVNRAIRSWLHEDRHEDASRIAGAVLDHVETTPRRRAGWPAWRSPIMNRFVTFGLGAAAVVLALFVGVQLLSSPDGGTGGQPTPTPTVEPTPEPTPSPAAGLPEGPHVILTGEADGPVDNIPPLTVTIPGPGWEGDVGGGILIKGDDAESSDGAGMIIFAQPEYIVYGDACHWETTVPDAPVTSVDEFVAALSSQGARDASEPVDITLGGYAGKSITLQVPADFDFTDCDPGYSGSWSCGGADEAPCGYHAGPEATDTVYILDIDGVIIAWETSYSTETSAEDVAELEAIVQSASFGE